MGPEGAHSGALGAVGALGEPGADLHLTGAVWATLHLASAGFAVQSAWHWLRAACGAPNARAQQHEALCGAATSTGALVYQGMACGLTGGVYAAGPARQGEGGRRVYFGLQYAGRAAAGALVLINLAALARERRPPSVALAIVWLLDVAALYLGTLVQGGQRLGFLASAAWLLLPLAGMLFSVMGGRLRSSPLHTTYRFLATWCVVCGGCYALVFLLSEVACMLNVETELVAYALLDGCVVSVSSFVVSRAGSDLQVGLLPAQEAELSLYPGPHNHGFYPNPDYYDDNL